MDVHMDDAWDNIDMDPSTQANENASKKMQLAELPKEMLEEILIHLDDRSYLHASHVCKSFASAAETAFAQKYSEKLYSIDCRHHAGSFQKVMLNKYGEKMRKVEIVHGDEEIFDLVERKCCHAKTLSSPNSRIILLKNLTEVRLGSVRSFDHEIFAEFIDNNPRLEFLELRDSDDVLLNMLDGRLNNLKTLKFDWVNSVGLLLPNIRLHSLETLHLGFTDTLHCVRFLQSLGCNLISKLVLMVDNFGLMFRNGDAVAEICKLKSLVSLELPRYCIASDDMIKLASHLPYLSEFSVRVADGDSRSLEKILSTTSMLPELSKLSIRLSFNDFHRLSNRFENSTNAFHARFAKSNIEINLTNHNYNFDSNMISITTDYLLMVQGSDSIELHWMDNLNEENVRKVLNSNRPAKELKFVNHCADRAFDISALAFTHTKCLDFKSNGPINVKPNVSRYHTWFPCLNVLKIHLEQHSANDFIRNLEANFCERIEKLWLHTIGDAEDPDMPNVLTKFGNLKSVHLGRL